MHTVTTPAPRGTAAAHLHASDRVARYTRRVGWSLHGMTPLPRPLFAGDTDCQGRTARLNFEDAHAIDCRVERTASRLYRLTSGSAVFVVQRAYPRVGDHPSQPAYVLAWNDAGAALYAERERAQRAELASLVVVPRTEAAR